MSESWIEKYNRIAPLDEQKHSSEQDDFGLFIQHSDLDHVVVDTDKAWNTVLTRLKKKRSSSTFTWVWKVAASILFILGTTIGVYTLVDPVSEATTYISEVTDLTNKTVTLPDGSMITLSKKSSIDYSEAEFLTNRTIRFEGEGFFEIIKSKYPFTIKTNNATIQVLGTSFGVDTRNNTRVSVANGLVSFQTKSDQKNIREGETAFIESENQLIEVTKTDPNELSWKTGKFEFSDTPLSKAFNYLNKYYDVTFTSNKALENCKITVQFNEESLSSVTEVLGTILNARSTVTDKEIRFSGKGCN